MPAPISHDQRDRTPRSCCWATRKCQLPGLPRLARKNDLQAASHAVEPARTPRRVGDRELGDRAFPSRSVTIRQWSPRAYSLKGRCSRTASALPLPCLSECWVARGVGGRAGSSAAPSVCGMRLAAAHDLAPASAAGECKQPLAHSMGLIRLIETFCLRLRGMRRAIILEGSQGFFRTGGEEHGQVAQCRSRVAR